MCGRHHNEHRERGHRSPPRGRVRSFIQPWLLLHLAQKPAHGYELMEQIVGDEDTLSVDPSLLYRTLRQFERAGLVRSSWDTEGSDPARRVYEITDDGVDYLHTWAVNIRRTQERLGQFLAEYEARFGREERR